MTEPNFPNPRGESLGRPASHLWDPSRPTASWRVENFRAEPGMGDWNVVHEAFPEERWCAVRGGTEAQARAIAPLRGMPTRAYRLERSSG